MAEIECLSNDVYHTNKYNAKRKADLSKYRLMCKMMCDEKQPLFIDNTWPPASVIILLCD